MKALILNSGIGSRMEDITSTHPKCMTEISSNETILSRQLRLIKAAGINDVIITTGYMADTLKDYCKVKREWSRRETESDKGDELCGLDPKPGDLSMSRLKQG